MKAQREREVVAGRRGGSLVLLLLPLSLSHRRWYRRASIAVNYNNIVIIIMAEDVARVAKAILPTSAGKVCANPFNLALPLALCINLAHLGCRTHAQDIKGCTRLIKEGPVVWSGRKEGEAVYLFLLNNILLLTEAPADDVRSLL